MAQPLRCTEEVQDGDVADHHGGPRSGRLPFIHRSFGSLPPHPDSPLPQEVPSVCLWSSTLPIQGPAIRTFLRSQGLHQSPGCNRSPPQIPGNTPLPLPGRHPCCRFFFFPGLSRSPQSLSLSRTTWLHSQHEKELSDSFSEPDTPGPANKLTSLPDFPVTGKATKDDLSPSPGTSCTFSNSDGLILLDGSHGIFPGYHSMGTLPPPSSPSLPQTLLTSYRTQGTYQPNPPPSGQTLPELVAGPTQTAIRSQPGNTGQNRHHHGRESMGLGSPSPIPNNSGDMVPQRATILDQQTRIESDPASPPTLQGSNPIIPCPHPNRQHLSKGLHKPSGGDEITRSNEGSNIPLQVGRGEHPLDQGRTFTRDPKHQCGLAEQTNSGRRRMGSPPPTLSTNHQSLRRSRNRSVRLSREQPGAHFSNQTPEPKSTRDQRLDLPMAKHPPVCLPSVPLNPTGAQKNQETTSNSYPGDPQLATPTVVSNTDQSLDGPSPHSSIQIGHASPGTADTPSTGTVQVDSLAFERIGMRRKGYSQKVQDILLASRRQSTNKIYSRTWSKFATWCRSNDINPSRPKVKHILEFLQEGVEKGLSTNTIKRQLATISSILGPRKHGTISTHHDAKRFIKGLKLLNPPTVHRFPTWNLHLVLKVLMGQPFEPLDSVPLKFVTLKTVFLVAITSARRVSELGSLSTHPNLCSFQNDRVVLRLDPSFMPKVNSVFHRSQDLILPTLCPNPKTDEEKAWHSLDVKRALSLYLSRSREYRKSEALFILYGGPSKGRKASVPSISRWLKVTIVEAYKAVGKDPPGGITAHSTRGAATSTVFEGFHSLEAICRAATWASADTFIRHYKIDQAASAEAAFGRRVLQAAGSV